MGVINQPAKEPESYWIKFPDNSILRSSRSMIKSQSQPSYFKLEAEGKEWSSTGSIPPCFHQPFNLMLPAVELPALPMDNLVPPPLTTKAAPPEQGNISVSSTSASQPSTSSGPVVIPSTPRWSTHSNKGIPPVRFTPSKKWAVCNGTLWKPVERLFLYSVRTYLVYLVCPQIRTCEAKWHCGKFLTFLIFSKFTSLSSICN